MFEKAISDDNEKGAKLHSILFKKIYTFNFHKINNERRH